MIINWQLRSTTSSFLFRGHPAVLRLARCSMGFLLATAWILAITTVAINVQVIADICFRLWTLTGRCNNWFRDLCSRRLPRRFQRCNHKHCNILSSHPCIILPPPLGLGLRPNHGFLHMLWSVYGRFIPRRRHLRLLGDFASQRRAVYAIWLTRIH